MRIPQLAALLLAIQFAQGLNAQEQPAEEPSSAEDDPLPGSTQPAPTSQPTSMPSLIPELPDYSGSLWERSFLTGDWGGMRTELAAKGFFFSLELEQTIQGSAHGGRDVNGAFGYSGSADLRFKFDTARMQLWPGGLLDLHAETLFGDFLNRKVGSLVNDDALYPLPGDAEFMLSHVTYTQALSEHLAVFAGKLDTTSGDQNEFAWIHGDNFLNSALRWNPVTARTTPYSTLGAGFAVIGDWGVWSFTAYDTEGLPDVSGFDTAFDGGTSVATEARFNVNLFGEPGHQLLGFAWSDKSFLTLDQDPRVGIRVPGGRVRNLVRVARAADRESGSWAFYYNFDQFVYTETEDPTQGIGLFGRFGISDGDANPIETFYSVGVGGKGIIPGRDQDRFGLGYYYTKWSDIPLVESLGIDHSQGIELFYNFEVTPWLRITPDLQIIVDPGGGLGSPDVAIVYGIRAQMSF